MNPDKLIRRLLTSPKYRKWGIIFERNFYDDTPNSVIMTLPRGRQLSDFPPPRFITATPFPATGRPNSYKLVVTALYRVPSDLKLTYRRSAVAASAGAP